MKLKTSIVQNMISKALKGASNTAMLEITRMMLIAVKDGELKMVTTDNSNTLEVTHAVEAEGEFYAVVRIDQVSKLLAKITTADVEFMVDEESKTLSIKGNGDYTIQLPLDEESELIEFPEIEGFNWDKKASKTVEAHALAALPKSHANSIRTSNDVPFLNAYYFDGDVGVVTTNHLNLTQTKLDVFKKQTLLPTELVDLFELLDGGVRIIVQEEKGKPTQYGFVGSGVRIHGFAKQGVEQFPIVQLMPMLEMEYPNICVVSQSMLSATLDRMTLFVGVYEDNATTLMFANGTLVVADSAQKNIEDVSFEVEMDEFEPYTCVINAVTFKDFVNAQALDNGLEIAFGIDGSIMLIANGLQHIIGLQ